MNDLDAILPSRLSRPVVGEPLTAVPRRTLFCRAARIVTALIQDYRLGEDSLLPDGTGGPFPPGDRRFVESADDVFRCPGCRRSAVVVQDVVLQLAGPLAALLVSPPEDHGLVLQDVEHDLRRVEEMMAEAAWGKGSLCCSSIDAAAQEAGALLAEYWPAVEALADVLLQGADLGPLDVLETLVTTILAAEKALPPGLEQRLRLELEEVRGRVRPGAQDRDALRRLTALVEQVAAAERHREPLREAVARAARALIHCFGGE